MSGYSSFVGEYVQEWLAMKIVRQVSGATAILFLLAGCAVQAHTEVAIPNLPACDAAFAMLPQPGGSSELNNRIPEAAPGPMRLCRYRWAAAKNKLALVADIELPLAPAALMHTLPLLKTEIEVYGPNVAFSCPASQGAIDIVIIRSATGSNLTILRVQRDGCSRVNVTHDNFATYIDYLYSKDLWAELDAIKATV